MPRFPVGYLFDGKDEDEAGPAVPPQPVPGVWATEGAHYDHVLPFAPPAGPKREFYRGQFSGVHVPGIKPLPGMAGFTVPDQKPIIMALDVFRWYILEGTFDGTCRAYFDWYRNVLGLTHWQASLGHMVEQGEKAGWSMSRILDAAVDFVGQAKAMGLWIDGWFIGGAGSFGTEYEDRSYSPGRDQDVTYWKPKFDPWIDALVVANRLLSHSCFCWQFEGGNTGDPRTINGKKQSPVQTIVDYFADRLRPNDVYTGEHNLYEAGSWDPDNNRRAWFDRNRDKISFWYHQSNHRQPIDLYQARLVDVLDVCAEHGNTQIIPYEYGAQGLFNRTGTDPYDFTERQVEHKGYLLLCTKAQQLCDHGFGGGGLLPDGSVL